MATQGGRNMLQVYNDSIVINSHIFHMQLLVLFSQSTNMMFQGQDWTASLGQKLG